MEKENSDKFPPYISSQENKKRAAVCGGAVDPMVGSCLHKDSIFSLNRRKRREIEGANVGNAEGGPF